VLAGGEIALFFGPLSADFYEFFDDFYPETCGHLTISTSRANNSSAASKATFSSTDAVWLSNCASVIVCSLRAYADTVISCAIVTRS